MICQVAPSNSKPVTIRDPTNRVYCLIGGPGRGFCTCTETGSLEPALLRKVRQNQPTRIATSRISPALKARSCRCNRLRRSRSAWPASLSSE